MQLNRIKSIFKEENNSNLSLLQLEEFYTEATKHKTTRGTNLKYVSAI